MSDNYPVAYKASIFSLNVLEAILGEDRLKAAQVGVCCFGLAVTGLSAALAIVSLLAGNSLFVELVAACAIAVILLLGVHLQPIYHPNLLGRIYNYMLLGLVLYAFMWSTAINWAKFSLALQKESRAERKIASIHALRQRIAYAKKRERLRQDAAKRGR